jgi:hypothetical protein
MRIQQMNVHMGTQQSVCGGRTLDRAANVEK